MANTKTIKYIQINTNILANIKYLLLKKCYGRKDLRDKFIKSLQDFLSLDLELVVAIFSGTSLMYNMLKTCGDLKHGILTQGVEERNVNKMQDQTLSNILLKINTKLGGRNWLLSPQNRLFSQYLNNLYDGMNLS